MVIGDKKSKVKVAQQSSKEPTDSEWKNDEGGGEEKSPGDYLKSSLTESVHKIGTDLGMCKFFPRFASHCPPMPMSTIPKTNRSTMNLDTYSIEQYIFILNTDSNRCKG